MSIKRWSSIPILAPFIEHVVNILMAQKSVLEERVQQVRYIPVVM